MRVYTYYNNRQNNGTPRVALPESTAIIIVVVLGFFYAKIIPLRRSLIHDENPFADGISKKMYKKV